jgi:hypothetical protein
MRQRLEVFHFVSVELDKDAMFVCGTQTRDALASIVDRPQVSPDRYSSETPSDNLDPLGHLFLIERPHLQVRVATDRRLNHALLTIEVFESLAVLCLGCAKSSLHLASFIVRGASESIQAHPASKIPQILRERMFNGMARGGNRDSPPVPQQPGWLSWQPPYPSVHGGRKQPNILF